MRIGFVIAGFFFFASAAFAQPKPPEIPPGAMVNLEQPGQNQHRPGNFGEGVPQITSSSTLHSRPRIVFPNLPVHGNSRWIVPMTSGIMRNLAVATTPITGDQPGDFRVGIWARGHAGGNDYEVILLDACNQPEARMCYTSRMEGHCEPRDTQACANTVTNWILDWVRWRQQRG